MTYEINLPICFARDHYERDLPCGELVRQTERLWTFNCTAPELREWLSDAVHFSVCAGQGWDIGPEAIGLQSSARATATRVRRFMKSHSISIRA